MAYKRSGQTGLPAYKCSGLAGFLFKMTEWLKSKMSERLHSIMKESHTAACECNILDYVKFRENN
jgi:hypothetical protein